MEQVFDVAYDTFFDETPKKRERKQLLREFVAHHTVVKYLLDKKAEFACEQVQLRTKHFVRCIGEAWAHCRCPTEHCECILKHPEYRNAVAAYNDAFKLNFDAMP